MAVLPVKIVSKTIKRGMFHTLSDVVAYLHLKRTTVFYIIIFLNSIVHTTT